MSSFEGEGRLLRAQLERNNKYYQYGVLRSPFKSLLFFHSCTVTLNARL